MNGEVFNCIRNGEEEDTVNNQFSHSYERSFTRNGRVNLNDKEEEVEVEEKKTEDKNEAREKEEENTEENKGVEVDLKKVEKEAENIKYKIENINISKTPENTNNFKFHNNFVNTGNKGSGNGGGNASTLNMKISMGRMSHGSNRVKRNANSMEKRGRKKKNNKLHYTNPDDKNPQIELHSGKNSTESMTKKNDIDYLSARTIIKEMVCHVRFCHPNEIYLIEDNYYICNKNGNSFTRYNQKVCDHSKRVIINYPIMFYSTYYDDKIRYMARGIESANNSTAVRKEDDNYGISIISGVYTNCTYNKSARKMDYDLVCIENHVIIDEEKQEPAICNINANGYTACVPDENNEFMCQPSSSYSFFKNIYTFNYYLFILTILSFIYLLF